jgi:hypothetical protein
MLASPWKRMAFSHAEYCIENEKGFSPGGMVCAGAKALFFNCAHRTAKAVPFHVGIKTYAAPL